MDNAVHLILQIGEDEMKITYGNDNNHLLMLL